ncbi:hypothetical protein GOBAR_DD23163 [Gossypium barbadense]|nr:hypothetical protein GOBAR_DD23163 [Gossypium barbadense]
MGEAYEKMMCCRVAGEDGVLGAEGNATVARLIEGVLRTFKSWKFSVGGVIAIHRIEELAGLFLLTGF